MYQPEEEGDGYLDPECGKISTLIMDGLKHGTEWLVVDETFICHVNSMYTGNAPNAGDLVALLRQVCR